MYKIVNYQSNTNQQGFPHGYQLYPAPQDPILIPIHFPPSPQPPLVPPQQQQQEEEDEEEHGNDEEHEHLQPVNQRAQYIINHRQVLATNHGRRYLKLAFSTIVLTVLGVLLSTVAPWFQVKERDDLTFYFRDHFLWIFLLPPLFCLPLLFSNIAFVGRLCWWHCWTVTIISIGVPAAVVFVSFGTTLVYSGVGTVVWTAGSYFVVVAYASCVLSGLLFMKLAHLIENGVPVVEPAPPAPGPITVHIGVDEDLPKEGKFDVWDSDGPGYARE